jgi:phenylacetyl-CoA:acceptor oxidoreductase subunit 2
MSFGPGPWPQQSWDARAAANFMLGGTGAGLVVAGALSGAGALPLAIGLACVAAGLTAVWLEIGRPLRAVNVLLRPGRSWMTRESYAAAALFAAGALALWRPLPALAAVVALAAAGFVYSQARILRAAKGIPAWRAPEIVPLVLATSAAEGLGVLAALAEPNGAIAAALVIAVLAREAAFGFYRTRTGAALAPGARAAIDSIRTVHFWLGTALPCAMVGIMVLYGGLARPPLAAAGLAALAAGWVLKFTLVVRAAYNQGFALPRLPVRGRRA